ncbi:membrane-bound alkaline phosphatase-like [Adelges cooleyi]|uniref:membrane-bound alkaline phosphatase-like n=1 Tax=Adelges cooleyi TaxID=133065 RepID=UPI00217FCCD2|nr:membrane-bound alkaline phosphatase-like [Adelges cooleyi]
MMLMKSFVFFLAYAAGGLSDYTENPGTDAEYWLKNGKLKIAEKLKIKLNTNKAKNLIIFMGDGMSPTTLMAARIYQGQLKNKTGKNENLSFEKFPYTGLIKSYCVDNIVADSSCTATAYLGGVRGNSRTVGVSGHVTFNDCPASTIASNQVDSIMQWAQWAGKATGIVTNTRVTHASPAGAYAHTCNRDWESDRSKMMSANLTDVEQCEDIGRQMVTRDPGRNFKVIMGGGRNKLMRKKTNSSGERNDEDLLDKWMADKQERFHGKTAKYITTRKELLTTDMSKTDFLLGLFHDDLLDYRLKADATKQPTLAEMTSKAIELLETEKDGFVLFVEGGLIDIANHGGLAKIALDETLELSKAVAAAVKLTREDDTLIVVTSDHAHVLTMSGYSKWGTDILGLSEKVDDDKKPYTTLAYASGPRTNTNSWQCHRANYTHVDFGDVDYIYSSMVPLRHGTHSGDDTIVFARGPWAHLFTGHYEQTMIPLAMAMAAGISTDPLSNELAYSLGISIFSVQHFTTTLVLLFLSIAVQMLR